ncbi:NUDIX domain-containing protein [Dongia deserti]|uniref:NUDIX domain-containing protein n=1 Tax=Dongia deserti TaxID=2268030 RepID=UPI0025498486|nr:NUDIX domain-containing protein [Dongia deserti]
MPKKKVQSVMENLPGSDRVRIEHVDVLSDNWYVLRKYTYMYRRRDGTEQRQAREAYDRGNGAVILLHDKERGTILLTRQFRLPAFVSGHPDGMLLELPAGLLDDDDPTTAVRREAEEETGYRIKDVKEVLSCYMSPGAVTEQLHFFTAEYTPADRVGAGGGHLGEGEDIEVVEVTLQDALAMIDRGEIIDAKTIILIYHARLKEII